MRIIFWILTLLVFNFTSETAFAGNIQLNEFMANPTDNTEWVELYNPTNQIIDLSDWKIKDGNNLASDDLTLTDRINPLSFITFDHNKGWLNDTGSETITLLDNNGQTIDSYSYSKTTKGKTYGRQPDGSNWIADLEPSKGSSNGEQSTPAPSPTPAPTPTPSPAPTPSKTPTPTATPKKTATPINSPTSTPVPLAPNPSNSTIPTNIPNYSRTSSRFNFKIASIAGIATISSNPSTSTKSAQVNVKNQNQINPLILIGLSLIFAGAGSIGYIYLKKNAKIHI